MIETRMSKLTIVVNVPYVDPEETDPESMAQDILSIPQHLVSATWEQDDTDTWVGSYDRIPR